jgi:hypothetical protein
MASEPPLLKRSATPLKRSSGSGVITAVAVAAVLMIGIQLGGVPWRYRKQLWQLQGVLVGAVVGYVVGRLSVGADRQEPPGG